MIRLVPIDSLTLKDLPDAKSYDLGKYANLESSNKKHKIDVSKDVHKKVFTIGRGTSNDIVLPDEEGPFLIPDVLPDSPSYAHTK